MIMLLVNIQQNLGHLNLVFSISKTTFQSRILIRIESVNLGV